MTMMLLSYQIFEERAQGDDSLRVRRDFVELRAELQVKCPEREIELDWIIVDVAERCTEHGEPMEWNYP